MHHSTSPTLKTIRLHCHYLKYKYIPAWFMTKLHYNLYHKKVCCISLKYRHIHTHTPSTCLNCQNSLKFFKTHQHTPLSDSRSDKYCESTPYFIEYRNTPRYVITIKLGQCHDGLVLLYSCDTRLHDSGSDHITQSKSTTLNGKNKPVKVPGGKQTCTHNNKKSSILISL